MPDQVFAPAARTAKALDATDGGRDYIVVNGTGPFYPQGAQPNRVCRVLNSGAAQTNAVNIYDSATPENPQSTELIWSGVLNASNVDGGVVSLQIPLKQSLSVKMAGALTSGTVILVTWH